MARIAFLSTFDQKCGIATYTRDLAQALTKRGHECFVFAEVDLTKDQRGVWGGIPFERTWHRTRVKLTNAIKDFDVVHVQHEWGLFRQDASAFARIVSNLRAFVTYHTPEVGICSWVGNNAGKQGNIDGRIFHSPVAASIHRGAYIPHGIGEQLPATRQPRGEVHYVVPGFVNYGKRTHKIVEAFSGADGWLSVLGTCRDEGYMANIENIARRQSNIHLDFRYMSDTTLSRACLEADFVVLGAPAKTAFSASGQMAQAYAQRTPVIARSSNIYANHGGGAWLFKNWSDLRDLFMGKAPWKLRDALKPMVEFVANERSWDTVAEMHERLYAGELK